MDSWHSYPSIYNLGHRAIRDLLSVNVNVEEKIDGSQFSFGVDASGEIHVRSKGAVMNVDAPEKMFTEAVDVVKSIRDKLVPGWTYRAEYLKKPKHNTLAYSRIPNNHLMVFDINPSHEEYIPYSEKEKEAERLGIEAVPLLTRDDSTVLTKSVNYWKRRAPSAGRKSRES